MTNDRDPLSLALYPRSFSGTAFNSEPAYFTFISETASLFVDEYTVEGSALKYEFVFEGRKRGRDLANLTLHLGGSPSSPPSLAEFFVKLEEGTTFIAVIHGDSVLP